MNEQTITLQQVETLKAHANVSYADAKAALEATGGEMLDALLWLERMGKIPADQTASYSTRGNETEPKTGPVTGRPAQPKEEKRQEDWGQKIKRFLLENRLEAYNRKTGRDFEVPVGVCIILLIIAFWMVPALLIIGFFLGWRYRMAGPDLGRNEVNETMEQINDTAETVVSEVVSEVKKNFK